MNDAFLAGFVETIRDLPGEADRLAQRDHAFLHPLPQGLALDVLHGDEHTAVRLAHFIDFADEGVVERGRRLRLAAQKFLGPGVAKCCAVDHLDRDFASQEEILGQKHLAHPAAANRVETAVAILRSGSAHGLRRVPSLVRGSSALKVKDRDLGRNAQTHRDDAGTDSGVDEKVPALPHDVAYRKVLPK